MRRAKPRVPEGRPFEPSDCWRQCPRLGRAKSRNFKDVCRFRCCAISDTPKLMPTSNPWVIPFWGDGRKTPFCKAEREGTGVRSYRAVRASARCKAFYACMSMKSSRNADRHRPPACGGCKSTSVQPTSLHRLSLRGADNPASRNHPSRSPP
jgi:hypothetical protein